MKLSLTGCVKTEVERGMREGMRDIHRYSDEITILEPTQHVLFEGPMHLPEDSEQSLNWPFSIQIPTTCTESKDRRYIEKSGFPPSDNGWVLPGSFFTSKNEMAMFSQATIE